jgi:hypothetical protein
MMIQFGVVISKRSDDCQNGGKESKMNAKELKLELLGVTKKFWVPRNKDEHDERRVILRGLPRPKVTEQQFRSFKEGLPENMTAHFYKTDPWVKYIEVIFKLFDLCCSWNVDGLVKDLVPFIDVESILVDPPLLHKRRTLFQPIELPVGYMRKEGFASHKAYLRNPEEILSGFLVEGQYNTWIELDNYPGEYFDPEYLRVVEEE